MFLRTFIIDFVFIKQRDVQLRDYKEAIKQRDVQLQEYKEAIKHRDAHHEEYKESIIQSYDRRLESLQSIIKLKDALIQQYEESMIRIDAHHKEYKGYAKQLQYNLEKELLMSKGLLNARGIFEHQLKKCFLEMWQVGLIKVNIVSFREDCFTTTIIKNLLIHMDSLPVNGLSSRLLKAATDYNCDLRTLYNTLNDDDIHGTPWSGPGIRMYMSHLGKEDGCFMSYLIEDYGDKVVYDMNEYDIMKSKK